MIVQFCILVLISSGSVFSAACLHRRYEEFLPITCSAIVLLLFLSGILGFLRAGVWIVSALCAGLYFFSTVWVIGKKSFNAFIKNLFTPAFFVFIIAFCALSLLNMGKMVANWDEFSHWADIVKVMVIIDDFGTSPLSHSIFQSYPPAMSLFQYFIQKVTLFLEPQSQFSEWRLYFAYQIFFLSFMFPFLKKLSFKQPLTIFAVSFAVSVAPLLFFYKVYTSTYIDPFLGILSGCGLASIFVAQKRDYVYYLSLFMIMAILVLSKEVGMLFSVFLLAALLLDEFCYKAEGVPFRCRFSKHFLGLLIGGVGSVFVPRLLWEMNIRANNAASAISQKLDLGVLLKVLTGQDNSYRTVIRNSYFQQLLVKKVSIGSTGISVSYIVLLAVMLSLLASYCLFSKNCPTEQRGRRKMLFWLISIQTLTYIVGLFLIYMFMFSEYEAVRFASFDRYMGIAFLAVWIFGIMIAVDLLQKMTVKAKRFAALTVCVMLIVTPLGTIRTFLFRTDVESSISFRQPYENMRESVEAITNGTPQRIYLVSQEDTGLDRLVISYSLRNCTFNTDFDWSIGEPFYEGDVWTKTMTAEEWKTELVNGYDYVIIYRINDYFKENFASVFADKGDIHETGTYRLNRETELLELCH